MLFYYTYRLTGFMYNNLQSLYKSVRLVNFMATTLYTYKNSSAQIGDFSLAPSIIKKYLYRDLSRLTQGVGGQIAKY